MNRREFKELVKEAIREVLDERQTTDTREEDYDLVRGAIGSDWREARTLVSTTGLTTRRVNQILLDLRLWDEVEWKKTGTKSGGGFKYLYRST